MNTGSETLMERRRNLCIDEIQTGTEGQKNEERKTLSAILTLVGEACSSQHTQTKSWNRAVGQSLS